MLPAVVRSDFNAVFGSVRLDGTRHTPASHSHGKQHGRSVVVEPQIAPISRQTAGANTGALAGVEDGNSSSASATSSAETVPSRCPKKIVVPSVLRARSPDIGDSARNNQSTVRLFSSFLI